MSDEMMLDIAKMSYELAMQDELSRYQFYVNTQRLVAALHAARAEAEAWKSVASTQSSLQDELTARLSTTMSLAAEIKALREEVEGLRAGHPAAIHCDNCGCSWLDDGLNPIGCPYCKQSEYEYTIAAQEAEIKALRAEVERLRADRDSWEQQASDRVADWYAEHLRAERMAEALREWWSTHRPVGWTEDQHRARPYVNLITVADKALTEAMLRDQEARNG